MADRAVAAEKPSPSIPPTDDGARTTRLIVGVALGLALLPLLVSALALFIHVGFGFHAVSDNALNELRVRDIGRHPVLLGPFARDRWFHPGPAMYYLLALPYWLSGGHSIGLMLGALLVNGGAILGMGLVARRLGGTPLVLLVLLGCGLVVRASGAAFMRDPWNPYITVMPFGLLVMLCWALTCGEAWALPLAAAVMSFCVQSHVGYAPLAIPLFVWGAAGLALFERRRNRTVDAPTLDHQAIRRWTAITVGVLVLMWLPPVLDEVWHSPGNFTKIYDFFRHPPEPSHTLVEGYRVVTAQFAATPEWVFGAGKANPFTGEPKFLHTSPLPLLLVPYLIALTVLLRRRLTDGARLAATVAAGLCFGVLAVKQTIGAVYVYRLRWTWILAMLAAVVTGWAAWLVAAGRRRQLETRWFVPLVLSALVILAGVNSVSAATAGKPDTPQSARLSGLIPSVVKALPESKGDVIIRNSFQDGGTAVGLFLALERRGIAVRVDDNPSLEGGVGSHRVHRKGPVRAVLFVAADEDIQRMSSNRDFHLVAYQGAVPRQELVQRYAALAAEPDAGTPAGKISIVKARALAKRLGFAAAVFIVSPEPH